MISVMTIKNLLFGEKNVTWPQYKLVVPSLNTELKGKNSIINLGTNIWKSISFDIRRANSLNYIQFRNSPIEATK